MQNLCMSFPIVVRVMRKNIQLMKSTDSLEILQNTPLMVKVAVREG